MLNILENIVEGRGEEGDIDTLLDLADLITNTALCGLGKTAASPVVSTLKYFREEYEAHIREKRCPSGSCKKLKKIYINREDCKGCSKCSRVCPVHAITGKIKEPYEIDASICIKCEACITACPFGAVKEG